MLRPSCPVRRLLDASAVCSRLIRSAMSPPSTAATTLFLLGAFSPLLVPRPSSLTSKAVLLFAGSSSLSCMLASSDGGRMENKARSWYSVSRMRAVMSFVCSMAFVKIFGLGKLGRVSIDRDELSSVFHTADPKWSVSIARSARDVCRAVTLS